MNKIILLLSCITLYSCASDYDKHLLEARNKMTTECMIDDPSKDRHVCKKEAEASVQKFKDMIGDR